MKSSVPLLALMFACCLAILSIADPPNGKQEFAPGALGMNVPVITLRKDLDANVGRLVAIRGELSSRSKVPSILGVEVQNSNDLVSKDAYAVGVLVRFEVTAEALKDASSNNRPIAGRGVGTFYTLYFDLAGKIAETRPWPKGE